MASQKGLAVIPISLLLDLWVLIVKKEWWLWQSHKEAKRFRLLLEGFVELPGHSGPRYRAAAETACRIREKLNANGDGIWICCLGASFRRQGRGVADRQRFLPPPHPAIPLAVPSSDSSPHQPQENLSYQTVNLSLCQNVSFPVAVGGNIMTCFNVVMSGRCILDGTHIKECMQTHSVGLWCSETAHMFQCCLTN